VCLGHPPLTSEIPASKGSARARIVIVKISDPQKSGVVEGTTEETMKDGGGAGNSSISLDSSQLEQR
jgi:hypothetical protein